MPNDLKLVADGQRNPTAVMATRFAAALGLRGEAADHICDQVGFTRAVTARSASAATKPAGASQLELELGADTERVCITFDREPPFYGEAGGALLRVDGSVRLLARDGRLDGELPVAPIAPDATSPPGCSGSALVRLRAHAGGTPE